MLHGHHTLLCYIRGCSSPVGWERWGGWQPLAKSWDEGSRLPAAPGSYCLARPGSWCPLRVASGHAVLAACPLPPPLEGVVLAAGPQVPRGVASHGLGGSQEALLGRNAVACSDRLFSSSLSPWAGGLPTAVSRWLPAPCPREAAPPCLSWSLVCGARRHISARGPGWGGLPTAGSSSLRTAGGPANGLPLVQFPG